MAQLLIEWDAEDSDGHDVHCGDSENGMIAQIAHFVLENFGSRRNLSLSGDLSDKGTWTYRKVP